MLKMKQGVRSGGTAGPPPGRSPAAAAGTGTPSPRGASRGAPLREGEAFWEQPPRPAFLPPFHTQEGREPGHVQEKQPPSLASEGGAEWVYGRRVPTTLLSACRGASGPNRSKSQPRGHEGSRGAGRWPSSAPRPRQHLFPRICSETRQLFHNPERRVGIDEDKSKDACPQPRPPRPRRATAGYSTVTGTFTRAGGPTASSKPDFPQEHTADLPTFPPKKQMPRTARGLPGR